MADITVHRYGDSINWTKLSLKHKSQWARKKKREWKGQGGGGRGKKKEKTKREI